MSRLSTSQSHSSHLAPWIGLGLILIVGVLQIATFADLRIDDGYITYRIAENWLAGHGPVFNPGERIQGSTAPAHLVLSMGVSALVGHDSLPHAMAVIGCLAWLAQSILVYFLLHPALGRWGALAVAAMLAIGAAQSYFWLSLETNLVTALALATLLAAHRGRWTLAAACAAAAGTARPDAFLLTILLAIPCLLATRREVWKPGLAWSIIALPWPIFATLYYGSPLPNTATAKLADTDLASYLGVLARLPSDRLLPLFDAWALPATYLLALVGTAVLVHRDRRLWPLPAWILLHATAYAILRPPLRHTWHLYPWIAGVGILLTAAVAAFLTIGPRWRRVVAIVVFALLAHGWWRQTLDNATHYPRQTFVGARDQAYRDVVRFLDAHAEPDDILAAREIGALGFWSGLPIHDMIGLVSADRDFPWKKAGFRWLLVRGQMAQEVKKDPRLIRRYAIRREEFIAVLFERVDFSEADAAPAVTDQPSAATP
ncbi:MAG: hypothetical protein AAGD38_02445 [Acidobacteriota bacterium]